MDTIDSALLFKSQITTYNFVAPTPNLVFHNANKEVGRFDFSGDTLKFTGDAEASAKVFIDYAAQCFSARIAEEAAKASKATVDWAVERWKAEVANRPLNNKNRRSLDDTWRQVVRKHGGDPDMLLGPSHDHEMAKDGGGA